MFGSKKSKISSTEKDVYLTGLLSQSEAFLHTSQSSSSAYEFRFDGVNMPLELSKIAGNINKALKIVEQKHEYELMKYKLANEALDLGLWDMEVAVNDPVNPNNSIMWSDQFRKMLGFSNKVDFPNNISSWSDRLHPEDKEIVLSKLEKHLNDRSGRTTYDLEYRLKLKNGQYRYFQMTGMTKRDFNGTPIHVAGTLKDINNKKIEIEAPQKTLGYDKLIAELNRMLALCKDNKGNNIKGDITGLSDDLENIMVLINTMLNEISQYNNYQLEKLKLINKVSNVGLFEMVIFNNNPGDPQSTFQWSEEMRNLLGYHGEKEFPNILNSWSEKLHPEDVQPTVGKLLSLLMDKVNDPFDLEYRLLKKTGEYGLFQAYGAAIHNTKNNSAKVFGAVKEITEQRQNKIDLDTLDMRINLLQKSINLALWDMTVNHENPMADSNEFWWSQEFRQLLGYRDEREFPNRLGSWSNLIHPEDKKKSLDAFLAHLNDFSGRTPYNVEYRIRKKTGEYIWLKSEGATLREKDGVPIRIVGSTEDISNRLHKTALDEHVKEFSDAIEKMSAGIMDILVSSKEMIEANKKNLDISLVTEKKASDTTAIVKAIQGIASQTSILGVNASIEAARSGIAGRGFKVVSEEIGRLSEQSKKAANQIEDELRAIQISVSEMTVDIKDAVSLVSKQASITENVKQVLNEVNSMYSELIEMINK